MLSGIEIDVALDDKGHRHPEEEGTFKMKEADCWQSQRTAESINRVAMIIIVKKYS